jgi:DNA-binding transcriptional regulator LsrR (DeoR family)
MNIMGSKRTEFQAKQLKMQILNLFDNTDLKGIDIAEKLGISRAYVSRVLTAEGRGTRINVPQTIKRIRELSKLRDSEIAMLVGLVNGSQIAVWANASSKPTNRYQIRLATLLKALENAKDE